MSSQEYAEMIEIPVSTCQMVTTTNRAPEKPPRKAFSFSLFKRAKKCEERSFDSYFDNTLSDVTDQTPTETAVFNADCNTEKDNLNCNCKDNCQNDCALDGSSACACTCDCTCDHATDCTCDCACDEAKCDCNDSNQPTCEQSNCSSQDDKTNPFTTKNASKTKKSGKINVIGVQVAAIFVLAVGILLTNLFWQDSGINKILKSAFTKQTPIVDERDYTEFNAICPTKGLAEIENNIITIPEKGAVYSPANGKVLSVEKIGDKFTITISHSDKYKTVICGADYVYANVGDSVFTSTPVCYSLNGGVEVSMYNDGTIISAFSISDGQIVWQS